MGGGTTEPAYPPAMHPLHDALERLFDALGKERSNAEYIASPLWNDVVDAAQRALAVLNADTRAAAMT